MEVKNLPALIEPARPVALPVTIAVGGLGNRIIFDADPADGTIAICTDGPTDIVFDPDDFQLIAELLLCTVDTNDR